MMRHITIYQIEDIANVDYAYRSFDKNKFNFNDYKKVYEFELEVSAQFRQTTTSIDSISSYKRSIIEDAIDTTDSVDPMFK